MKKIILFDLISRDFEHSNFNYSFYLALQKHINVELYISRSSAYYLEKSGVQLNKNIKFIHIVDYLPYLLRLIYAYFFCIKFIFLKNTRLVISGYELKSFVLLSLFCPFLLFKRNNIDLISHNHFQKFISFKYKHLVKFTFSFFGFRFISLSASVEKVMHTYFNSKYIVLLIHPIADKSTKISGKDNINDVINFFSIGRHTHFSNLMEIIIMFSKINYSNKVLHLPLSARYYIETHPDFKVFEIRYFDALDRKSYLKILDKMDVLILPYDKSLLYRASGVALDSVFHGNLVLCEVNFYDELNMSFTDGSVFDFTKITQNQIIYENKVCKSFEQYCLA